MLGQGKDIILEKYLQLVSEELIKDYGIVETENLRMSIFENIKNLLLNKKINEIDNLTFQEMLKEETKDILLEKVRQNEFDVFSYRSEIGQKSFLSRMSDDKKDMIELGLIYSLSGYTSKDFNYGESIMNREYRRMGYSNLEVLHSNHSDGINLLLWGRNCKAHEQNGIVKALV